MNNKEISKRFITITEKLLEQYGLKAEYKDHRAYDDHRITFVTDDDYLSFFFLGDSDGGDQRIYTSGNKKLKYHVEFNTQKQCLKFILDYFNINTLRQAKKLSKSLNKELKINQEVKTKRIKL